MTTRALCVEITRRIRLVFELRAARHVSPSPRKQCCGRSAMEEEKTQTSDFYRTEPNLPHRFNNPGGFHGYSQRRMNPLYRTSNQTYGSKRPTVHEMQTQYRTVSHQFSEAMLQTGMYRDYGFNTSIEKSRVSMATLHKRSYLHHLHHHGDQGSEAAAEKPKQNNP